MKKTEFGKPEEQQPQQSSEYHPPFHFGFCRGGLVRVVFDVV